MSPNIVGWDRLVRYVPKGGNGEIRYGEPLLDGTNADDIAELAKSGDLKVRMLEGSDALSAKPTQTIDVVGMLLGPLAQKDVPIIRCIGLNYKSHILEGVRQLPTCPTIFTKPAPCVADHGEDIPIPVIAQEQCVHEGELVVLIGKDAKDVSAEDALEYVAGYTAGNDISARDWQRDLAKAGPVPQWTFSKSFDKYLPLGPLLVSSHILGAANHQVLTTRVNGQLRQHAIPLIYALTSVSSWSSAVQGQTLQKGSLIATGTPGGVGLFMQPPTFLKDGDEVTVEIEGIGRLANRVRFEGSTEKKAA